MKHSRWIRVMILAGTAFLSTAWGVDGVILIDQNRALAGNVTPGDTAGFPVTISQPGSYRLSSNLTVPPGSNGVEIAVPRVTFDLNGFSITPQQEVVDAVPPFYYGIAYVGAATPREIVLHNGVIGGFGIPLELRGPNRQIANRCQLCSASDLTLRMPEGSGTSLVLGNYVRVFNVTAKGLHIRVTCPSVVTKTVAGAISVNAISPGDPDPVNEGECAFADNATN